MNRRTKRILLLSLSLLFTLSLPVAAGYEEGKKIFEAKCASCHSAYVPADKIKENFFEKENKLLNLKAPTVNMLAWAIMEGPRKVGDPNDPEMRQTEIEEYLRESLEDPDPDESICDGHFMNYYARKAPIRGLSDAELSDLALYLMEYKKHRLAKAPMVTRRFNKDMDVQQLLAEAKRSGKTIIIEAGSPTCHYCKKMEQEVIDTPEVRSRLQKDFILVEVNVEETRLPLGLEKVYRHITPSFFFLTPGGRLLEQFPGSWTRHDFLMMLEQFRPQRMSRRKRGK